MEAQTLWLFIGMMLAGLTVILGGGVMFLLWKKTDLIIDLLRSRCHEEHVAFIIEPGPGYKLAGRKKKKGVVCLTEFELIFIPHLGNAPVQLPLTDVSDYRESEMDQFHIIITTTDPDLSFFFRAPQTWIEKARQRQPA